MINGKKYICTSGESIGEVVVIEVTDKSLLHWQAFAKPTKQEAIEDFIESTQLYLQNAKQLLKEVNKP